MVNTLLISDFDLLETYLYYDGPRLYTIKHNTGQLVLCLIVYNEIENYIDQYLYILLDTNDLNWLENKSLSLNTFFDYKSEVGQMYLINHDVDYIDIDLLKCKPFTKFQSCEWFDDRIYLTE